jgi:CubicO group peptidase (beta-lactamase class C family)
MNEPLLSKTSQLEDFGQEVFPKACAWLEECTTKGWQLGSQIYVSVGSTPRLDLGLGECRLGHAMTREVLNLWFSSGKPVTAVAIGQLVERGTLGWDDPVARWLPEFGRHGKEVLELRHLLTHAGGFRAADQVPEDTAWPEVLAQICDAPLEPGAVPGSHAAYHTHSSWSVLAEIVQRAASQPFDDYVAEHIFRPVGMNSSFVRLDAEKHAALEPRLGWMHLTDRGQMDPHPFWNTPQSAAILRPGAFLRGPIHDLGRFYEALLADPSPLLRRETIAVMTRRQREGMFDDTFKHKIDFGFGFIINSNRYGLETVPYGFGRHASDDAFGHGGVQTSCAFADPRHGLVVAWVCNGLPGIRIHHKRGRELNTLIYEDLGLS